jgi:hypothetical protein
MRVIIPTLLGLAALAATSVQAAPLPNKAHPHRNVWKSQQYDYLLSTNSSFLAYRVKKECGPIKALAVRSDCVGSFSVYEPW